MKNYSLLFIIWVISFDTASAQQVINLSFEKSTEKIQRQAKAITFPITLLSDTIQIPKDSLVLYKVEAKVNDNKSTIPASAYKLEFNSINLEKLPSKYTFFLTIEGDTIADRDRILFLDLELIKKGKKTPLKSKSNNLSLAITVEGFKGINKYNYLGYVGTNFDLIDGVKAKDLFFAVNVLSAPKETSDLFGFYLTLYGNRTISQTDTSGRVTYTSRILGMKGDSARYYTSQALKTITSVSDNLGATFTPLFKLNKFSENGRNTKIYYAPQFEFIWRRKTITTKYADIVLVDSLDRANRPIRGNFVTPTINTVPLNVYDMYLGLAGMFLSHENEFISIRVQATLGYNFSYIANNSKSNIDGNTPYIKEENFFSYMRTWITEPISGLTFGAEVSNNIFNKNRYRPYYNVTLSKAINLNALGAIFQPVTSR